MYIRENETASVLYSVQRETSDGSLEVVTIKIPYEDKNTLHVLVDDIQITSEAQQTTPYTWVWDGQKVRISPAVASGSEVLIRRVSTADEMKNIFNGQAQFTDQAMDENFKQLLWLAQEYGEGSGLRDVFSNINMHGYKITNTGWATDPDDVVTYGQYLQDAQGARQAAQKAQQALQDAQGILDRAQTVTDQLQQTNQDIQQTWSQTQADMAEAVQTTQQTAQQAQDTLRALQEQIQQSINSATGDIGSAIDTGKAQIDAAVEQAKVSVNQSATSAVNTVTQIKQSAIDQINDGLVQANTAVTTAKAWAVKMDGMVNEQDYSSKYYANQSKSEATKAATSSSSAQASKNAAQAAKQAAQNAQASVQDIIPAVIAEGDKQVQRVTSQGNTQVLAVNSAKDTSLAQLNSALESHKSTLQQIGDQQVQEVQQQGTASVALVTAEGTKQIELAKAQADRATEQANASQASATSSAQKASQAATSAGAAKTYETNAAASATTATQQASAASQSATNSSNSANTSRQQADRAKSQADRAQQYANNLQVGQIQADWNQTDSSQKDYIKNKPVLATVATSGSYNDLTDVPQIPDPTWDNIQNKPTDYPPSAHTHTKNQITDFAHTHQIAQVNGLQTALNGKQPVGDYATNTALTQGLASKQPTGNYATKEQLTEGLAGKQPTGDYAAATHNHTASQITDLNSTLAPYMKTTAADAKYATQTSLSTGLSGKVSTSGNETINGTKTFAASPIIPTPTADNHAVPKSYVDGMQDDTAASILAAFQQFNQENGIT